MAISEIRAIAILSAALQEIAFLEPDEPVDEWAEAQAFHRAQKIAKEAIAKVEKDMLS